MLHQMPPLSCGVRCGLALTSPSAPQQTQQTFQGPPFPSPDMEPGPCLERSSPPQLWDYVLTKMNSKAPDLGDNHNGKLVWMDGWCTSGLVEDMSAAAEELEKGKSHGFKEGSAFAGCKSQMLGLKEALDSLIQLDANLPDIENIIYTAQKCSGKENQEYAMCLHAHICSNGLEGYVRVANHIIPMFVECRSIPNAQQVLDRLVHRTEHSWTSLISGYIQCGQFQDALDLHQKMLDDCVHPSSYTLVALLKACAGLRDLERGRQIHNEIKQNNFLKDLPVGNTLVGMYAKCGSLTEAQEVFDKLLVRSVVSWTALIAGYAEHGPGEAALNCFSQMQQDCITPNDVTFACVLKACGSIGAISKGQEIHADIALKGLGRDLLVGNSLIDMYAKCDLLVEAQEVFDKLTVRDVVSWTALIGGYAESGSGQEALKCFDQMQSQGVSVNAVTFACALKACGSIGATEKGRKIHLEVAQNGYEDDISVGNTLVGMYAKWGSFIEAREVFDRLPVRDVVSWTALTAGYAEHGRGQEAVAFFEQMQLEGISPNRVAFACALKACGSIGAIHKGHKIHGEVTKKGLDKDPFVANTLISLYARCCSLSEAERVFEKLPVLDVVAWSSMIKGYGLNHKGGMAMQCFEGMQDHGLTPNAVTFTCLLMACSHASLVVDGQEYFNMMREDYGISPLAEHYACMVDLFARSGHLFKAEKFLESLCPPSKEAWAALLTACKTHGEVELGLRCFQELVKLDQKDGAWYVLMADIYASAGRWDDAHKTEELRKCAGAYKKPAIAVIEVNQKVHEFVVGHNQSKEISSMLQSLSIRLKEEGHMPRVGQVLRTIPDKEKESALCEHAEKLAIAFGLLNTPGGETLRVTKNLRMCNDCHTTSKILSKVEKREIILQDNCCVHHFKDGLCSCGDMF